MRKQSDYGVQLEEKQKYRFTFGLGERQMRKYYERARRAPGSTGAALVERLESSLSNVAFRIGWAASRAQARQMVSHGHVNVNGKRVNVPTFELRPGDRLELKAPKALVESARSAIAAARKLPSWLERDEDGLSGKMLTKPTLEESSVPGKVHLVVEYYTR